MENDHEIENDNDLDQAEGNFQEKAQNMQNNLANGKTVINKLKSRTSVNIVPKSVNIVQRPTPVSYARRVIPKT